MFLISQVLNAKEEDLNELLEILDCFFDPEKKAVQPKPRFYQNNNRRPRRISNNKKYIPNVNNNNSDSSAISNESPIKTENIKQEEVEVA